MSTDFKSMTNLERHSVSHDYWNKHDFETFAVIFEPVLDYREHERNIHVTSVDEMRKFATELWASFPDMQITDAEYFDAGGGWTVAKFMIRGTNSGPFQGHPPTGKQVALAACEWAHWTDKGKAAGGDMYLCLIPALIQLGVVKPA